MCGYGSHKPALLLGLRDYGIEGQIGLEKTLDEYLEKMFAITAELKRVLKKTGTMFWNHGDSYATARPMGTNDNGSTGGLAGGRTPFSRSHQKKTRGNLLNNGIPEKSLIFQAHRLAIRMIDEQDWILRNTIIWHKPNAMPSSVKDRFTCDWEPVFFFTKSKKYWFEQQFEGSSGKTWEGFNLRVRAAEKGKSPQYRASNEEQRKYADKKNYNGGGSKLHNHSGNYDADGNFIGIPGKRNMRSVWKIPSSPFPEAHFATFPPELIETPIKAGCPKGGGSA